MTRDRRLLAAVWLASAAIVAAGSLLAYHFLTRVDELAGRRDPADLYQDPALLFTDPGILGTAVELRVAAAVRSCMADAGYDYRGPAVLSDLDTLLDPAADGYGVAAGPGAPRPRLGDGGPAGLDQGGYEQALYGGTLSGAGDAAPGGCAAVGRAALDDALASLGSLPYSLEQLQADASTHPAWLAALGQWSACMAERGFSAASPGDLIVAQTAALALASGDAARAVAEREREAAAADFACRESTLDPALGRVAADLAPIFVNRNRTQLEALIPSPGGPPVDQGLGTGDVQVTLRWGSLVDLDLAVTDPSGASIDYVNPRRLEGLGREFALFQGFVRAEVARGDAMAALGAYRAYTLRPLLEVVRMRHCPERYDYGPKYSRHDLPAEVVARLEHLFFVPDIWGIAARQAEAESWFAETVNALERDGIRL